MPKAAASDPSRATPDEWAARLSGAPDLSSDRTKWSRALLRHWTGTSPHMDQPPLDHHYIVQHLGGPKRVERRSDGIPVSKVVEEGAITIVPLGSQFKWHTEGPIEFAHLYISPALLDSTAMRFERPNGFLLRDEVGCRDPLLEALYASMLRELRRPTGPDTLLLDCLLETFLIQLILAHSTVQAKTPRRCETLATYQLRKVTEYVEVNLSRSLELADLARAAGGSVFHFSRAFKHTVGFAPYHYVLRRRIECAKSMLGSGDQPLAVIAQACGFGTAANFARTFRRLVGVTPTRYRLRQV